MDVIICKTSADAEKLAARMIADAINAKPEFKLGLATGATMENVYAELSRLNQAGEVDFSQVRSWNLDEYAGLAPEHDQSYRYYMNTKLFDHINIDLKNTNVPCGSAEDADAECEAYECKIANAGGVDLQVVGMGPNGHVGFNEPGESLVGPTHKTALTPSTIAANSRFFESADLVPTMALTMGMKSILSARKIVVVVNGAAKHEPLQKLLSGDISTKYPITFLNLHNDVTLFCDKEAYYGKNK